jgi:hypothetical protein
MIQTQLIKGQMSKKAKLQTALLYAFLCYTTKKGTHFHTNVANFASPFPF